eukprot:COSAG01_NODE_495_length_16308_cov_92.317088_17_plen_34_part_00
MLAATQLGWQLTTVDFDNGASSHIFGLSYVVSH